MNDQKKINVEEIFKVASNIHHRLFNHKHFINGEINYLINKTEKSDCKNNDIYVDQIEIKQKNKLDEINQIPKLISLNKLKSINKNFEKLISFSDQILENEIIFEKKISEQKQQFSNELNKLEKEIESTNQENLENLQSFLDKKKIEVAKYYHELEAKWEV